jgi:hypothetical protein
MIYHNHHDSQGMRGRAREERGRAREERGRAREEKGEQEKRRDKNKILPGARRYDMTAMT